MQSANQYLEKTRSAVEWLFEGIGTYVALSRESSMPFVTSYVSEEDFQRQYDVLQVEHQSKGKAALEAQKQFLGESFALATLCGAVLQLAAKGIECYSMNTQIPEGWESFISSGSKPVPFCIGRLVGGVPLGLVVYAARNQHTHFEDQNLREPNVEVFRRLAMDHGYGKGSKKPIVHTAFHLGTEGINSFAANVTALIRWRSLKEYESDMRQMLGI